MPCTLSLKIFLRIPAQLLCEIVLPYTTQRRGNFRASKDQPQASSKLCQLGRH